MKMKNVLMASAYMVLGASFMTGFSACSDNENTPEPEELSQQEQALKAVIEDYVNKSVVPTYKGLADAAIELADACRAMCNAGPSNLTEDMVKSKPERNGLLPAVTGS